MRVLRYVKQLIKYRTLSSSLVKKRKNKKLEIQISNEAERKLKKKSC